MDNKKGISLISLIITIIVIIILAATVIFNGFGATESAGFAKFAQEFSSYQEELNERYQNEKLHSSMQGDIKIDSEIYAEIAGGAEQAISSLLGGETLSDGLNGTNCYEIQGARSFYSGQAGVYITDKGEVFALPGYRYSQNGEERRYVTSSKYYTGSGSVTPGGNGGITLAKTTLDSDDSSAEMWELLGAIADAISNKASITNDSNEAEVTLKVNGNDITYTINVGDTFKVAYNGDPKVVRVMGFNHDTLANDPSKKAGISFEFVDVIMEDTKMHSVATNENGWVAKDLYATLNLGSNAAWKNLSNSEVIKQVIKTYKSFNPNKIDTTEDRLWLLAESELIGNSAYSVEGEQYKYFKGFSISVEGGNLVFVKPSDAVWYNGNSWWLRSPSWGASSAFLIVDGQGGFGDSSAIGAFIPAPAVAPGFCI